MNGAVNGPVVAIGLPVSIMSGMHAHGVGNCPANVQSFLTGTTIIEVLLIKVLFFNNQFNTPSCCEECASGNVKYLFVTMSVIVPFLLRGLCFWQCH